MGPDSWIGDIIEFFNLEGKVPFLIDWLKRSVSGVENTSEWHLTTETALSFIADLIF